MLLLRQMEATSTQALMSKVSLLTIGQQAILDAYLCMLHLTTGARASLSTWQHNTRSIQPPAMSQQGRGLQA